MLYEDRIKTDRAGFIAKVVNIAQLIGIEPEWLMQLMKQECDFDHTKANPWSGAVGLIQFMPDTAKSLGTSIERLKAMTQVQQLNYVYQYLKPYTNKMQSFVDLYFAVFFPLAMNKADDWVLETQKLSRSKIAQQNPAYDRNKDGKVTVAEVKAAIMGKVPTAWRTFFEKKKKPSRSAPGRSSSLQH